MIRSLDVRVTIDGLGAPVDVAIVHAKTTFGGIDHYVIGLGHSGNLLASYGAIAYCGALHLGERIGGNAPAEVRDAAIAALAPAFAHDYDPPRAPCMCGCRGRS